MTECIVNALAPIGDYNLVAVMGLARFYEPKGSAGGEFSLLGSTMPERLWGRNQTKSIHGQAEFGNLD